MLLTSPLITLKDAITLNYTCPYCKKNQTQETPHDHLFLRSNLNNNTWVRLLPLWTNAPQRLIRQCLYHYLLPQVTNDHTKVPKSQSQNIATRSPVAS